MLALASQRRRGSLDARTWSCSLFNLGRAYFRFPLLRLDQAWRTLAFFSSPQDYSTNTLVVDRLASVAMAFLGPAVRWPDVLGMNATVLFEKAQPHLPAPMAGMDADLFMSLCLSFTIIALIMVSSTILKSRTRKGIPVAASSSGRKPRRGDTPTVLLVGPSSVGKTSIFSGLTLGCVPSAHPSQRGSESVVSLTSARKLRLVDTPGHARLRAREVQGYLPGVDVVVFCIDAKDALRGGASAGISTSKDAMGGTTSGGLTEAVDHLHAVLTSLAQSRLRQGASTSSSAPALILALSRADLSPHLANVDLASQAEEDQKRKRALLARAKAAVEVELGRRRAGMRLGRNASAKIGGMSHVAGSGQADGVWASIKKILGLGGSTGSGKHAEDEDEEEEEPADYVDWTLLERGSSAAFSLDKLDINVVQDGKALISFASVGKERGWEERAIEGLKELQTTLLSV